MCWLWYSFENLKVQITVEDMEYWQHVKERELTWSGNQAQTPKNNGHLSWALNKRMSMINEKKEVLEHRVVHNFYLLIKSFHILGAHCNGPSFLFNNSNLCLSLSLAGVLLVLLFYWSLQRISFRCHWRSFIFFTYIFVNYNQVIYIQ